jgi:MYXO-CTERM domain-containing protein
MNPPSAFLKYQLPAIVWSITIVGLSAIPRVPVDISVFGADKLLHAVVYAILCSLVWRALWFQNRIELLRRYSVPSAFLFSCGFGILNEWLQMQAPGRSPDVYDAIANGTGALAVVLVLLWRRRRREGQRTI